MHKHRHHFYFLSALVLTVLSGLLIDGPLYVVTVFLLQLLLACTITVVRHRNIDQWFYDHVESTYFLISIFVGTSLLYLSMVPFMIDSWMSNVQLLLLFILPGAFLTTGLTWYAARHMHHYTLTQKDYVGIVQVSILCMLVVFAGNMFMVDAMVPEPWLSHDYDESMLALHQEGFQDIEFIRDVTEIFERERAILEQTKIADDAYDPLCVFNDCLNARVEGYKLSGHILGLNNFAQNAVRTILEVDNQIESSNLSTVHQNVLDTYVEYSVQPPFSIWQSLFDEYAHANSFVLRGYQKLMSNSQYGNILFRVKFYDFDFKYRRMMELDMNESQLSQTYRYKFLSDDFY